MWLELLTLPVREKYTNGPSCGKRKCKKVFFVDLIQTRANVFIGKRFLAFPSHELILFGENCFLILISFGMDHKKQGRGVQKVNVTNNF